MIPAFRNFATLYHISFADRLDKYSSLQVLVYGDCAVNTDPDPEQLAKIGITSAETAAAFGIEPRVAFLSYSTFGSGAGPDVDKASSSPLSV